MAKENTRNSTRTWVTASATLVLECLHADVPVCSLCLPIYLSPMSLHRVKDQTESNVQNTDVFTSFSLIDPCASMWSRIRLAAPKPSLHAVAFVAAESSTSSRNAVDVNVEYA